MQSEKRLFIGRNPELTKLEDAYKAKTSQLVVLYGRRRIGKSTLLEHFCDNKFNFFFTGRKKEREEDLIERLLHELSLFFHNPLISKITTRDWKDIFEVIDHERKEKKLIIIFDEFQWMCTLQSTLISALQEYWDKKWKNESSIFLILCGSIISFMEKEVLSEKSPLFGRRTFSFELEALPLSSAIQFFPKRHYREQIEILMSFGGVPRYLELIDKKESLSQHINRTALSKSGYYVNEIHYILGEQLRKPKRYYELLEALSVKVLSREELAHALAIENSGALQHYLTTLLNLRLIKRSIPIDKDEESKMQRYKICDEYTRFYFTFIKPHKERIVLNEDDEWLFDQFIAPVWPSYCGYAFELFCEKNIRAIISCLGIKNVFKRYGPYWRAPTKMTKGVQIDLVIERTDNVTHLIECKWSSGLIGKSIIDELERKKRLYPNPHNHTLRLGLIVASEVTEQVKKSKILDDIIMVKDILGL